MKQMAGFVDEDFYDFRQVCGAQSVKLFDRSYMDRRPLAEDLPVQVETLGRLVAFVLDTNLDNPDALEADFFDEGRFAAAFRREIAKANEEGYARITASADEPDVQRGYILVTMMRGFSKPKKEIDALLQAQRKNREQAEQGRAPALVPAFTPPGATRTAVGPLEIRRRAPQKRTVMPELVPGALALRRRSPPLVRGSAEQMGLPFLTSPKSKSRSRSPLPPPPFGGGATDADSAVSVGGESSLTRLLSQLGRIDCMSELWTVDTDNLRKLFPQALREREPRVVVAEMMFESATVEPDVVIDEP